MTIEFAMNVFPWIYCAAIIVFIALWLIDYARNNSDPEDYSTPGKTYVSCAYISMLGMIGAWSVKNIWETSENFSPVLAMIIELALLIFIIHFVCRVLHWLRIVMDGRKSKDD